MARFQIEYCGAKIFAEIDSPLKALTRMPIFHSRILCRTIVK